MSEHPVARALAATVEVDGVTKRFGEKVALDGVSFAIDPGRVLALLGPNGAGKTTIIRILTTLLRPDGGRARVAGFDVERDATSIRSLIGLAGQYAAVDELLTGRENLELVGLLYHLERSEYRRRAAGALARMGLSDAADALVKTYSGGMRRRLDVAASLIARPPVLFLDEPTTGLDPRTRNDLWEFIEELVSAGTTVLLTTQYMEEAEHLADDIIVLDLGRVVAKGTADELKDRLGSDVLEVRVRDVADLEVAISTVAPFSDAPARVDAGLRQLSLPIKGGANVLLAAGRALEDRGVELVDVGIRRPSLDDVFLALTGHGVEAERAESDRG